MPGDVEELETKPEVPVKPVEPVEPAEPVEPVKRLDFTLMDSLTSFLYSEDDPLPILCGYFNKIM